ncbi:MAG: ketose-bisphosphate aldolase [Clostridia bacterium]|nr:ketose-bisphosphate aldolase [Clostridia bacterium]
MPLVNTKFMFKKAYAEHYAIGAFNVCNMETVQGIAEACKQAQSPIIFQVSPGAQKYAGIKYLANLVKIAVDKTGIEAALHLDHGNSFELCKTCIENGFTSVMIDGSSLEFDKNIELTKKVVDYARNKNISVESELGRLQGVEDHVECPNEHSLFTDPEQVKEFVEKTGVDSLAIAIGTSHGVNKFGPDTVPDLKFDILKKIEKIAPGFPIVLHGASSVNKNIIQELLKFGVNISGAKGVPEEMLCKAAKMSVCKINIDSDLRLAITLAIKKFMAENPEKFDPRGYFGAAREAVCELVKNKILNVLGSFKKSEP